MLRHPRQVSTHATIAGAVAGAFALLVYGPFVPVSSAGAAVSQPPVTPVSAPAATFVDLGTAASYSVLGGTGVTNTGAATVLADDLGLSPSGVIAGFPPGTTKGTIHDKDAAAEQAQSDRQDAYDAAAAETSTGALTGDQAGATFTPGVYTSAAAVTNTGTMTLDAAGDSSAVFVFQVGAAFSSAAASKIVLKNGALANNVFWQVQGVAIGAGAKVVGTFLGAGAISFGEGATIKGRALAATTVSLANTPFAEPKDDLTATRDHDRRRGRPVGQRHHTPDHRHHGRAGRSAADVTVAGQTLTTTVGAGGVWSVGRGDPHRGRSPGGGDDLGRLPEHQHRHPGPDRRRDRAAGVDRRWRRVGDQRRHDTHDRRHDRPAGWYAGDGHRRRADTDHDLGWRWLDRHRHDAERDVVRRRGVRRRRSRQHRHRASGPHHRRDEARRDDRRRRIAVDPRLLTLDLRDDRRTGRQHRAGHRRRPAPDRHRAQRRHLGRQRA